MTRKIAVLTSLLAVFYLLEACRKMIPKAPPDNEVLAGTIPGLTGQQEKEHLIGDAAFGKSFTAAEGLGPIFVQTSCSNCHVGNGKGHPSTLLSRFAKVEVSLVDYLIEKGGPQLQQHAIAGYDIETIPAEANVVSHRLAPAVMGLGYVAALSDASILANEDPIDLNGDGISGRVNYVFPSPFFIPQPIHIPVGSKYIGRFGKKAEKVTIMDQVVFALKQDMGITSDFDTEDLYNIKNGIKTGDNVADPEVSSAFVNSLVFYMRTLKAPPRRNADDPVVLAGEKLFESVGCAKCHITTFKTDKSDIDALSDQTFHPYSDFLIHNMGTLLEDGYWEGSANGNEWRTPPLWGIGLAKESQGGEMFLLHDGRAKTFESAINFHDGEAANVKANFKALNEEQKNQVYKFLESL